MQNLLYELCRLHRNIYIFEQFHIAISLNKYISNFLYWRRINESMIELKVEITVAMLFDQGESGLVSSVLESLTSKLENQPFAAPPVIEIWGCIWIVHSISRPTSIKRTKSQQEELT